MNATATPSTIQLGAPSGATYELDDRAERIQPAAVHSYISMKSYWGRHRSYEETERLIGEATRVSGLYELTTGLQVGFARVVSDRASFAYFADLYVLEQHRGQGLGLALAKFAIDGDPELAELNWLLHTRDAHALYTRLGFDPDDTRVMGRRRRI